MRTPCRHCWSLRIWRPVECKSSENSRCALQSPNPCYSVPGKFPVTVVKVIGGQHACLTRPAACFVVGSHYALAPNPGRRPQVHQLALKRGVVGVKQNRLQSKLGETGVGPPSLGGTQASFWCSFLGGIRQVAPAHRLPGSHLRVHTEPSKGLFPLVRSRQPLREVCIFFFSPWKSPSTLE